AHLFISPHSLIIGSAKQMGGNPKTRCFGSLFSAPDAVSIRDVARYRDARQWNCKSWRDFVMATTQGTITSFTTTPKSSLSIDGTGYTVETAGKSYSLTQPDSQTLRFEIQRGDQAWFDGGSAVDRAEIQDHQMIPAGTPVNINYQF